MKRGRVLLIFIIITLFARKAAYASTSDIILQINQYRESKQLTPLIENKILDLSAKNKACDLSVNNYFSHTDLSNHTFDWWIMETGYRYYSAGENLAKNFKGDNEIVSEWINSYPHRINLESEDFKEIGVGYCKEYVVVHFGNPRLDTILITFIRSLITSFHS